MTNDEFLAQWFSGGMYYAGADVRGPASASVGWDWLLAVDRKHLRPFTRDLLNLPPTEGVGLHLEELRLGYHAYLQFQDLLPVVLDGETPPENRHYPYYESVHYLRAAVISLLDKNSLAASTLHRPFLELAITQLYWMRRAEANGFDQYYEWLKGSTNKPPFRTMLDYVMDRLPSRELVPTARYDVLRATLAQMYRGASEYHHAPAPLDSMVTSGGSLTHPSPFPFIQAFFTSGLILRQVILLFVLAMPLSLFPLPLHRKFGFSPPVGVFLDEAAGLVLNRYLGDSAVGSLSSQLRRAEEVEQRLSWFERLPELTDEELDASWESYRQDVDAPASDDLDTRLLLSKATYRATAWFMNYRFDDDRPELPDDIAEQLIDRGRSWPSS